MAQWEPFAQKPKDPSAHWTQLGALDGQHPLTPLEQVQPVKPAPQHTPFDNVVPGGQTQLAPVPEHTPCTGHATQVPPQRLEPEGQFPHALKEQVPPLQLKLQLPQLFASFVVSTQVPWQRVVPGQFPH
jgi:hypothetical protein